ncbi:DUF4129 domain-containing protein [Microbacterium sp. YY-01]|uniref:DUF4129 domain-containing protein n=1 Tax=Microbacterium sp. YY-01 TaxID=3421634 RepID=UPI003D17AF85
MRPYGTTLGLLVIVLAIATVQGYPQLHPVSWGRGSQLSNESVFDETVESPPPELVPPGDNRVAMIIAIVVSVIAVLVLSVIVIRLISRIITRLIEAWRARRPPVRTESHASDEVVAAHDQESIDAQVVRQGIADALHSINRPGHVSDSIVAAWMGLEEAAARFGYVRGVAETPSEFVVRIVTSRDGIEGDTNTLLGLYQRVRFAGYTANELDRKAARRALERLDERWQEQ